MQPIIKNVNALWNELAKALKDTGNWEAIPMREWNFTRFNQMLADQTKAERAHRAHVQWGEPYPVSAAIGAKLLLLHSVGEGAKLTNKPDAIHMMYWRDSARLAYLLGYVLREELKWEFINACAALDYAEVMNPPATAIPIPVHSTK